MIEILRLMKKQDRKPVSLQKVRKLKTACKRFRAGVNVQKDGLWYYHPSRLNDFVYSDEGNREDREVFDTLVDTGKAVRVADGMVACYPGNPTEYGCIIYMKRFAILSEMQEHVTNLRQQYAVIVPHTHYLANEEHISRVYLSKRIKRADAHVLYLKNNVVTEGNHQFIERKVERKVA